MRTSYPDIELLTSESFKGRLAGEMERATREGHAYAVIACVPQHLPGEGMGDIVGIAADSVRGLVRKGDLAGRLTAEVVVVGAPETTASGARALAHRLQSELSLRSAHWQSTKWEAGFACRPKEGSPPEELLKAAIEAAKTRRRHLALHGAGLPLPIYIPSQV